MASSFSASDPTPDTIADAGSTLASPAHSLLHNGLRDGLRAVQQVVAGILANGWVTTARIANGAVTDAKIAGVAASKIAGPLEFSSLRSTTTVQADTYLRAGSGTGNPYFAVQRYGGVLDSSGNATVAHNIANGNERVVIVQAGYKGDSNEWTRIDGDSPTSSAVAVDGGNLHVFGGALLAGRAWRGAILYTQDQVPW